MRQTSTRRPIHAATTALVVLVCACSAGIGTAAPPVGSASAPGAAAPMQLSIMVGGLHYRAAFHDQHGKAVSERAFVAGAAEHQRFTTRLDSGARTATLTLLPIGADQPGSQPTSEFSAAAAAAASLATTSSSGTNVPATSRARPEPGTALAHFDLPRVGGGRLDSADFRGMPYIVDFFFAKCVACIKELPALNAFHRTHPTQPVVAMTFDGAATATRFVNRHQFDWPVAYGDMQYALKIGVRAYPTMVLVGADGRVLATRVGYTRGVTAASLEQWVDAATHHQPAQRAAGA